MPSNPDDIDTLLDSVPYSINDDMRSLLDSTEESSGMDWKESGYEGAIDYRIRQLSYSALLNLHSCPRKFQLNRLRSTHRTEESIQSTITFSFGHVVGEALQLALQGLDESEIIWKMFLAWHTPDLFDKDEKRNKSFFEAVIALKRFKSLCNAGFLQEYELVYYNNKPACELSFAIIFPDGFRLRGYVDAVLRHTRTGKILVLECKTTSSTNLNPVTYKNSAQAIGYSIVLDVLYPDLSSYEVLYLVYTTKDREYHPIPFTKTYLQRAIWIRELLLDIETIKLYEQEGIYPMRGESCYTFSRECEYINTCTLSTEMLTKKCTEAEEDKAEYQITLTLADLLEAQMRKVTE